MQTSAEDMATAKSQETASVSGFTTDKSGFAIPIYVIMKEENRIGKNGKKYAVAMVVEGKGNTLKQLNFPLEYDEKLKEGSFYLLLNTTLGSNINLNNKSMVLQTKPFDVPQDIIEKYKKAPSVTVVQALGSPEKTRLTISGFLKRASPVYQTEKSSRRVLFIKDTTSEEDDCPMVPVKLWGNKSSLLVPSENTPISITNIEMRTYEGSLEGNSTTTTTIEIDTNEEDIEGEIDAASFDLDNSKIIVDGSLYTIKYDLLQHIFKNCTFKSGVKVRGKKQANQITSVIQVNGKKQKKE